MMEKILTIIIPSYNMEDYIANNLESLLISNLDEVEILVINDGSKDRTSEIAHGYETHYPQSIRVIDKENGHYGSCINRGLKEATGKYVKILDADDSFDTDNFESYISFLKHQDADMIISDFIIVTNKIIIQKIEYGKVSSSPALFKDCVRQIISRPLDMHSITYRTKMLREINYIQTEGVAYTDMEWDFKPTLHVESVIFYNRPLYKYLIGRNGQSIELTTKGKSVDILISLIEGMLKYYINLPNKLPEKEIFAAYQLAKALSFVYHWILLKDYCTLNIEKLKKLDSTLKSKFSSAYVQLEQEVVSPFLQVNYIKHWRRNYILDKVSLKILRVLYALKQKAYILR